jgi:hypothetical protein
MQSVSIETKWSRKSIRMWQGLQTIMDCKMKTSPIADIDVLLPDKLNNFFACFEDNTVPMTWPATKNCRLSFSVANKCFTHNFLWLGAVLSSLYE